MVLHLASVWKGGLEQLGNGLYSYDLEMIIWNTTTTGNELEGSNLIGLANGVKRVRLLVGLANT